MLSLIIVLCIIILIIIINQLFYNREGLTTGDYKPYDLNNPQNTLILAQQNAGNISVLKQQLDELLGLNKQVKELSNNYTSLQEQVNGLVAAQQQYASQISGGQPPVITGTLSNPSSIAN
jgi:TolA-binding protein